MIRQILDRDFLLARLLNAPAILAELPNRLAADPDLAREISAAGVAPQEVVANIQTLCDMAARQIASESQPLDRVAFLARDAVLGLFQSALESYYEHYEPRTIRQASAKGFANGVPAVTDVELVGVRQTEPPKRFFTQFSDSDVRFLTRCGLAMGMQALGGRRPFNERPAAPVEISNNARLVLVGDWATGVPRARKVSEAMRKILTEAGADHRDQHVVHLGDVYYAGFPYEVERRFLQFWPVRPGEESKISSWCLNANHDMYSGGYGYFDHLLADKRFARQKQCSYFSMHTDYWQILGLDTAYDGNFSLHKQCDWVEQTLKSSNRKGLMLSHHQLFSAYESGGEKLEGILQKVLAQGLIRAWFWGHEHRCVLYKPHKHVEFGRCLGNGGVPVHTSDDPDPEIVLKVIQGVFPEVFDLWALMGFSVLDFEDAKIRVRYIDENSHVWHEEVIA